MMEAEEAERCGLVSRIVPAADLLAEAMRVASRIASMGRPSTVAAKDAINRAFESSLAEGILFERRMFQAMFGTEDQKEGMGGLHRKAAADLQKSLTHSVAESYKPPFLISTFVKKQVFDPWPTTMSAASAPSSRRSRR